MIKCFKSGDNGLAWIDRSKTSFLSIHTIQDKSPLQMHLPSYSALDVFPSLFQTRQSTLKAILIFSNHSYFHGSLLKQINQQVRRCKETIHNNNMTNTIQILHQMHYNFIFDLCFIYLCTMQVFLQSVQVYI